LSRFFADDFRGRAPVAVAVGFARGALNKKRFDFFLVCMAARV